MPRSNKKRGASQQDTASPPPQGPHAVLSTPLYQTYQTSVTPPPRSTATPPRIASVPVYQAKTPPGPVQPVQLAAPPGPVQLGPVQFPAGMLSDAVSMTGGSHDGVVTRDDFLAAQGLRYTPRQSTSRQSTPRQSTPRQSAQVIHSPVPAVQAPVDKKAAETLEAAKAALQETRAAVTSSYEQLQSEIIKPPAEPVQAAEEVQLEDAEEPAEGTLSRSRAATMELLGSVQEAAHARLDSAKQSVRSVVNVAQTKTVELGHKAVEVAGNRHVQATAAGAAGGAVVLGTSGATTGLVTGGLAGGIIGLVPAIFTFGLSIPLGVAVGAGTGLAVGSTVGGTAGAVSGGAAGYGMYAKRVELKEGAQQTIAKVSEGADFVKCRAAAATGYVKEKATLARVRIVGGGTGGLEASDGSD